MVEKLSTLDEWTTESTENRIQSIIPQDFDEGKEVHLITDQSFCLAYRGHHAETGC
jgi:serine protease inhibitor